MSEQAQAPANALKLLEAFDEAARSCHCAWGKGPTADYERLHRNYQVAKALLYAEISRLQINADAGEAFVFGRIVD